ncbi:hypothetical protein ACFL47_10910 [Candidatus Latescibacterota bacterium]
MGKNITVPGPVGHMPVELDLRLQTAWLESKRKDNIKPFIDAANGFLKELNLSAPVPAIDLPIRDAPDIYVGSSKSFNSPLNNYGDDEDKRPMYVYYSNPTGVWKEKFLTMVSNENNDFYLYITIGFSEYFLRNKNILGSKELEIGTGYTEQAKWLSSLDTPSEVLHFTGIVINKEGTILRAGAEGIVAKRPDLFDSIFNLRDPINDEELKKLLTEIRRDDLPGKPLNWQVALQNLVAQLLNRSDNILKK